MKNRTLFRYIPCRGFCCETKILQNFCCKVWGNKNETFSKLASNKKSTYLVLSSWKFIKMITSWGDYFHQVLWGYDKKWGFFGFPIFYYWPILKSAWFLFPQTLFEWKYLLLEEYIHDCTHWKDIQLTYLVCLFRRLEKANFDFLLRLPTSIVPLLGSRSKDERISWW